MIENNVQQFLAASRAHLLDLVCKHTGQGNVTAAPRAC